MSDAAVSERVVTFKAGDGRALNLINVRVGARAGAPPVLLVHGAGVRANIFRAPSGHTIVDSLVAEGRDVWLLNWRASIDFPPNHWTLDQAALHDHPAAVRTVMSETGAGSVQAIIHCQGSTSFMMAAVAGLVPDVSTIVTNAVSLHPTVTSLTRLKLRTIVPATARLIGYIDPQWGDGGAPWVVPKLVTAWVRATHHECNNMVCKMSSFTYGTGEPTLWRHENLNPLTHEWVREEFAHVPLTFFSQILRCVDAGHLVSVSGDPSLPESFVAQPPASDARVAFFAGQLNACFQAESQRRSYEWWQEQRPGDHTLRIVPGYGHLDMFMGQRAAQDVFPLMLAELERGT